MRIVKYILVLAILTNLLSLAVPDYSPLPPQPIVETKKVPPAKKFPILRKSYPGHSARWYARLHNYLLHMDRLKRLAAQQMAFAAWIDGLSRYKRHPWPCIAVAETSNIPATGPTYWTRYGVVIDIIEDFGTSAEQAAIFGGYATLAQEFAPVERFANVHGFGGWGELTKRKCGL